MARVPIPGKLLMALAPNDAVPIVAARRLSSPSNFSIAARSTARVSRAWKRIDVFVDGTNLFDETYHEIAGVAMPGRWITAGFTLK